MFYLNKDDTSGERYAQSATIEFVDGCYDPLNSAWIRDLRRLPVYGTIKISSQEYRPDLLGIDIYADQTLWPIVMWYNGFQSEEDLKAGVTVNFPVLSAVDALYYTLIAKQNVYANGRS